MNKIFLFTIFFISTTIVDAQIKTATFDDGEEINYEVISTDPNDEPKVIIGVASNLVNLYMSQWHGHVDASYYHLSYNNKRFNTTLYYGTWLQGIDGLLFLTSSDKHIEKRVFLKQVAFDRTTRTHYKTTENQVSRKHFGIHLGYNRLNYSKLSSFNEDDDTFLKYNGLQTSEFIVGLAFLQRRSIRTLVLLNRPIKAGAYRQFGLYSDVIYFTNTKSNIEDISDNIGLKLTFDYKSMFYYERFAFGYFIKGGVEYGPLFYNILPIINLGVIVGL